MTSKKKTDVTATGARNNLPAPVIDVLLPGGLLPASHQGKALTFVVDDWSVDDPPTDARKHELQVFWNERGGNRVEISSPPTLEQRTLTVPPGDLTTEGTFEVRYQVVVGADTWIRSDGVNVTIDLTAPTLPPAPNAPTFPQEVIDAGELTQEYLDAEGGLTITVPAYTGGAADDVITVYWDTAADDDTIIATYTVQTGDVDNPIPVTIPAADIIAAGSGARQVRYTLADQAGNATAPSEYAPLTVSLEDDTDGDLDPPQFNDGDIADKTDGTVKKDVLLADQGMDVLIPEWKNHATFPDDVDRVRLGWSSAVDPPQNWEDYEVINEVVFNGTTDPDAFPLLAHIPPEALDVDGRFWLRYQVELFNTELSYGPAVPLICDRVPPWAHLEPVAPDVPDDPVTDAYLDANPAGVEWTLPDYDLYQPGDIVYYWWLNELPPEEQLPTPETAAVTGSPMTLHVRPELVRETGDGGCVLLYAIIDKATNRSRISDYSRITVALGPLPDGLKDPEVPLAADGVVDLLDVVTGVTVAIPRFQNAKPTDRIRVTWGGTLLREEEVGSAPGDPILVQVPAAVLGEVYGDGAGAVATTVGYQIVRGDLPVPDAPLETIVDVDLSVIGPDLPGWPDVPDVVNPNLDAARVFGATSQTLNTLTRQDEDQPAELKFNLYDPVNADEIIDFYWDGTLVEEATHTVQAGEAPGQEITVSIPWAYIAAAGNNPTLPVYYRIWGPGSPNYQQSPTTLVNADAYTEKLPAPAFMKLNANGQLNCQSLDGADYALLVSIPDLSAWLVEGDTVTVTWVAYWDDPDGDLIEIPAAGLTEVVTLNATTVKGFQWRIVPYDQKILPIYEYDQRPEGERYGGGYGDAKYELVFNGETLYSLVDHKRVLMFHGGGSCDVGALDDSEGP